MLFSADYGGIGRMDFGKSLSIIAAIPAVGLGLAAMPSRAAAPQPVFACKTISGKLVRFAREGKVLRYSYGKPGMAPELTFTVPMASVRFGGSGPAGSGTWWVSRDVTVVFNGTRYTGHWAFHRAEGTEEAGVTVARGGKTLAETACRSDIQIDIPEVEE